MQCTNITCVWLYRHLCGKKVVAVVQASNLLPPPPPLQAGLIWRAIKMNVKFFNWDRALALAEQHKQHVDSVLWYRQRFLEAAKQQETNPKFMQMSEAMAIDEQHIRQKIQEERVKEAQRPGAKRYI